MKRLYVLGAGVPTPAPERFGTAYVLQLGNERLLFDCGPATTHKLVKSGLWPTQINHVFFTHHHFDHNADYPCFLLCRWDQCIGREPALRVYGPEPTKLITERLIGENGAFVFDWKARISWPTSQRVFVNRGGTLPRPAPQVEAVDIRSGARIEGTGWSVLAGGAMHAQPWLESLAYRVDCGGWRIVFAGDTGYCRPVVELARGCDVLVVNCWDRQENMDSNGEAAGQTGTRDAARFAVEAGVKTLILTHIGQRLSAPDSMEQAVALIAREFHGRIIVAAEGMALDLDAEEP